MKRQIKYRYYVEALPKTDMDIFEADAIERGEHLQYWEKIYNDTFDNDLFRGHLEPFRLHNRKIAENKIKQIKENCAGENI